MAALGHLRAWACVLVLEENVQDSEGLLESLSVEYREAWYKSVPYLPLRRS